MADKIKILLQSTIPYEQNNWHIGRFSLLKEHLESIRSEDGERLYEVTARDRDPDSDGTDQLLSAIDDDGFDEIWLFAADSGNGLAAAECEALNRFRVKGGGILATRDHQDLGSSLYSISGIGQANYFHSLNQDPDETRRIRDDQNTSSIDFPNFHSGLNGDFQEIEPVEPVHSLLRRRDGDAIRYFPAHPHEGAVGPPLDDLSARVVAYGTSRITGASFNLVVAFDTSQNRNAEDLGRAVVHSSFHHFADYNWDPSLGCPDFVTEAPGQGFARKPEALDDIKAYVENLANWLSPNNLVPK